MYTNNFSKNEYGEVPVIPRDVPASELIYTSAAGNSHFIPRGYRPVYSEREMLKAMFAVFEFFRTSGIQLAETNVRLLNDGAVLSHALVKTAEVLAMKGVVVKTRVVLRKKGKDGKPAEAVITGALPSSYYGNVDWFRLQMKLRLKKGADRYRPTAEKAGDADSEFFMFRIPGTDDHMIGTPAVLEDMRTLYPGLDLDVSRVAASAPQRVRTNAPSPRPDGRVRTEGGW